jgi:hypothetical protein
MAEPAITETPVLQEQANLKEYKKAAFESDIILKSKSLKYGHRLLQTSPANPDQIIDLAIQAYSCRLPTLAEIKDQDDKVTAEAKLLMRLNSLNRLAEEFGSKNAPENLRITINNLQQVLGLSETKTAGDVALAFLNKQIAEAKKQDNSLRELTEEEKQAVKSGRVDIFSLVGRSKTQTEDFLKNLPDLSIDPVERSLLQKITSDQILSRLNQSLWGEISFEDFRLKVETDWTDFIKSFQKNTIQKIITFPSQIPNFILNNI